MKGKRKKPSKHHPEAKGLLFLAIGLTLLLSLVSYIDGDYHRNWLGLVGHCAGVGLSYLFGLGSYLVVAYLFWAGWRLLTKQKVENLAVKTFYFTTFLISFCILSNLFAETQGLDFSFFRERVYSESVLLQSPFPYRHTRYNLGGVPFYYLYRDLPTYNLQDLLSNVGVALTFSMVGLVSFILLMEISVLNVLRRTKEILIEVGAFLGRLVKSFRGRELPEKPLMPLAEELDFPDFEPPPIEPVIHEPSPPFEEAPPLRPKPTAKETLEKFAAKPKGYKSQYSSYRLPPLTLLTNAKKIDQPLLKKDLMRQAQILEETLASFGIQAKVGEVNCGPTITSFEVHPAVGVKVQKIKTLENDIALNLQAASIRIIAPIPGKAAVGVEVPSKQPQEVGFKEMLASYKKSPRKAHIPILLGKKVSGENVIGDLTKWPHAIIAGATGSGKSVCINTIIMSILMNARPDEIKLLLIDPKKVELTPYSSLPHMIAPVITEPRGALAALNWIVKEMQYRYEILKQLGLRNITAFNSRKIKRNLEESLEIPIPEKMHGIVAIIDEFADLMMTATSDLETPIARIAQMARAVGIHLILATQRPSREVITGLIKANFPTRIAFKVASRVNSQIILDENGAESLLGNGDCLFLPPGSSELIRTQGAYIRDEDINRVISYICDQASPDYLIKSFDTMSHEEILGISNDEPRDELYERALETVLLSRNASTTYLQRKLKIGYARAASLMDELESHGVIGPQEGSKSRQILITSAD